MVGFPSADVGRGYAPAWRHFGVPVIWQLGVARRRRIDSSAIRAMKYVNRAVLCLGVLVIGLLPSLALANAQLTGFTVEPSGPTTPTAPGCSPAPQSWAALTNTIGADTAGLPLLLTDGRVMMQDITTYSGWWALSPIRSSGFL